MTTATIDHRSAKALEIVGAAATWQTGRTRGGRPFYAVPSQSAPNAFHMTDAVACTCRDHVHRGVTCKHIRAVVALEALSAPQVAVAAPHPRLPGLPRRVRLGLLRRRLASG